MKILGNKEPLDIFCEASEILNNAVIHTLGPNGTNTAVQHQNGHYEIINDGKTIIENITSLEPDIAPALETLKQASFETNRKAGDGTTSTTVIMNALLQGAKTYLEANSQIKPVYLRDTLEQVKDLSIKAINDIKQNIEPGDYAKVATVALGSDKYSEMIADIFQFLGKGKKPVLLKSDIPNIEVEKIDGVSLTKSKIVSNLFIKSTEFSKGLDIICLYQPVNRFQELTQLLRKVQQTGNDTILFYNQLSSDILENILFNYTNGAIKLIPVSLAGYGQGAYSIMKELADYCNCNVVDNVECKVSEISKIIFGHVDYGILNSEQIILKSAKKNIEKNYLHLDEKSVIMRLGGTNIIEREEVFRRVEDAINSLASAIEFGIVPGAGRTYSLIIDKILKDYPNIPEFIVKAMRLIKNRVCTSNTPDNIYDSALVTEEVIKNAFSIVSQVVTTKVVIHENIR